MALTDLLHRCPCCGAAPLEGKDARARCPDCGATFDASAADGVLVTVGSSSRRVPAADLLEEVAQRPPRDLAQGRLESRVTLRVTTGEVPLRYRGTLLGFREKFGPAVPGAARVDGERLYFTPTTGGTRTWDLADVRAVQGASSSLQLSLLGGKVLHLHFDDTSPLWWEGELHRMLRALWTRLGRGEIDEFQPWIRASTQSGRADAEPEAKP